VQRAAQSASDRERLRPHAQRLPECVHLHAVHHRRQPVLAPVRVEVQVSCAWRKSPG
jgi:hypothetical protein